MTGGKIFIENDDTIDLYKTFHKYDKLPALVERLTKGSKFKFFLDIDEKEDRDGLKIFYTGDEIKKFINKIQEILSGCGIPNKYILMKNNRKNKYHIIFDFIVEIYQAKKLTALIKDRTNLNIDNSVYKSGLRILHAIKNNGDDSNYEVIVNTITTDPHYIFIDTSILNLYDQYSITNEIPSVEGDNINSESESSVYNDVDFNDDELKIIELLKEKCDEIHGVKLTINNYNGYNVDYDHSYNCPVSGTLHNKMECFIKKYNNGAIKLYCYSENCKGESLTLIKGDDPIMNDEFFTDTSLASLFIENYGDNFIYQNKMVYHWNGDVWRCGDQADNILQNKLSKEFYKLVVDIILDTCEGVIATTWLKTSLSLRSRKRKPYIIKEICGLLTNTDIIFDNNKSMDYCVNFKNGLIDLKKIKNCSNGDFSKSFRKRERDDYVKSVLDYDFISSGLENNKNYIDEIISSQLPNGKDREFIYRWFSYCMTGDTTEQKYLCSIGYKASNGKSTQSKIFDTCLPIYTKKFDNRTFSSNYSKSHKQFIHLQSRPIRYTYIEEIDQSNMDANLLKDYVDGYKLNVERLYGTSEDVHLKSKLNICSNKDLTLQNADEGTLRRGIQLNFNVKFTSADAYEEMKNKDGYAIGNKNLLNELFECEDSDKNKNAFIHLLLDRVSDVIDNGLNENKYINNVFKETMEDYDTFKTFIDDTYDKTDDNNDRVSIVDFLDGYNDTLSKKITRNELVKEIKRVGLIYDRKKKQMDYMV